MVYVLNFEKIAENEIDVYTKTCLCNHAANLEDALKQCQSLIKCGWSAVGYLEYAQLRDACQALGISTAETGQDQSVRTRCKKHKRMHNTLFDRFKIYYDYMLQNPLTLSALKEVGA